MSGIKLNGIGVYNNMQQETNSDMTHLHLGPWKASHNKSVLVCLQSAARN